MGRSRGGWEASARAWVDRLRLAHLIDELAGRLLLLDEPSAALAPRLIEAVYDTIRALPQHEVGLLIVEQNVEMILGVAQRVFVLDLGRNAFDGSPAELRRSDRIRRLYLGEVGDA
jgi:branched-chain amino acid transport system ATP-binding protein